MDHFSEICSLVLLRTAQISCVVPLFTGAIMLKRLNKPLQLVYVYIVLCAFMEALSAYKASNSGNTMQLHHVFSLLEFLLLTAVYYLYFKDRHIRYYLLLVVLISFPIAYWDYKTNKDLFNTLSQSYQGFFLVTYALLFLGRSLWDQQSVVIWRQPMFWISSGILLFFSFNAIFFMVYNMILHPELDRKMFGSLYLITSLLAYLFYARAFWCMRWIKK